MEIQVQLFAQLRDAAGASNFSLELPAESTASDLLAAAYQRFPALKKWNDSILIGAGLEFVGHDYILQPNEVIAIMPPVQGG